MTYQITGRDVKMNDDELNELTIEIRKILDDKTARILKDEPLPKLYEILSAYTYIDKEEIAEIDKAIKKYGLVSSVFGVTDHRMHIGLEPIL